MLRSRLDTIARTLDEQIDPAIRNAAEAVAAAAKSRVPVDSGALRDSITVDRRGDGEYAVTAGDRDAFYAKMVEFGTTRTPARPYLIPALEAERDNLDTWLRAALRDL